MGDSVGVWMIVLFFAILVGLIGLNARYNKSFKIEATWIAVAISPAIVWLLTTGQLTELAGFGLEVKLRAAAKESVRDSYESLPIEPVALESRSKEGFAALERMIAQRIPGLKFELRKTGYYEDSAIRTYLERLTKHDFFRYVLFVKADGTFAGIAPGREVRDFIEEQPGRIVDMIESGEIDDLPGIVTEWIRTGSEKQEALTLFQSIDSPVLPVVDARDVFVGVIHRDRLVSDILLQLVTTS